MGVAPHDEESRWWQGLGLRDRRLKDMAPSVPELNASGKDRRAILNAVCPDWVRSMVDKLQARSAMSKRNGRSVTREREEIERS